MLSMTDPVVTPTEAQTYLEAGGVLQGWPTDEDLQSQAIIRGQRYIAANYNGHWRTSWTTPPEAVRQAVIEAALIEARTPGFFSRTFTPAEAKVLTEVKGIKWTLIGGSSDSMSPSSTIIDGLLYPHVLLRKGPFLGVWSV